jgi:hypothetical protein
MKTTGIILIIRYLCGKFSNKNGVKQGDGLSPWLLNGALEYATRKIPESRKELKFSVPHQLLV